MQITLRNLKFEDYLALKQASIEAYSGYGNAHWQPEQIRTLLHIFPEGQFCILVDGKIAASALSIIVDYSRFGDTHTYDQIIANATFSTHTPDGDVLYGIDIFVHPDYRGMRLGRRLYDARKELCENLNLRSIVFGGRMPGYSKMAGEISAKEYIEKVKMKEVFDPVLTFQLSNGFHVKKILTNYLPGDVESREYAALLEWNNIYYTPQISAAQKSVVRVGVVQWQMRLFSSLEALIEQVEYFVDAVSAYHCDFVVFPEFFNAPLMVEFNHLGPVESLRALASFTESVKEKFKEFAISYNVNIIGGSMPVVERGKIYNVSHLFHRNGSLNEIRKLHITPNEMESYGMSGGKEIDVIETDAGRVGILICYDVEFPELARLLAERGMQILFVPFLTDTQNGYNRIRHCARARAIENECYVAIAGCVGNLPRVSNMDIQFAQSAVFTPSDFSFPTNTIKAEATANTEMILIADLDLHLLKELNVYGTVRNLRDRRKDLYTIRWHRKK